MHFKGKDGACKINIYFDFSLMSETPAAAGGFYNAFLVFQETKFELKGNVRNGKDFKF